MLKGLEHLLDNDLDKDADAGSSLRELDRGHRDGQPGLTMSKLDMSPEHNEHSNSQLFDMGRSAKRLAQADDAADQAEDVESVEEPNEWVIVHNKKVIETLQFEATAQLYGPKAVTDEGEPAPWRNNWCGNKKLENFTNYSNDKRRRFIVLPDGPDAFKTLETLQGRLRVPVGENAYVISVTKEAFPHVANINDRHNRYYGEHRNFLLDDAIRAVKELRQVIHLAPWDGELGKLSWDGIKYAEIWADAGFEPHEAREYMDTRAFRDSVGRADDEHDLLSFLRVYKKHNQKELNAADVDVCWATGISVDELLQLHSNYFTNDDIKNWADLTHFGGERLPVDLYVEMKEQGLTENHLKFVRKINELYDYSGDIYHNPEAVAHATKVYAALEEAAPVVFDTHNEFVPDVVSWIRKDLQRRVSWIRRSGIDYDIIWALQNLNVAPREDLNSYVSLAQKAGFTPVQLDESTPNTIPTVKDLIKYLQGQGHAVEVPTKGRLQQLLDAAGVVNGLLNGEPVPSFKTMPELVEWLKSRGALKRQGFKQIASKLLAEHQEASRKIAAYHPFRAGEIRLASKAAHPIRQYSKKEALDEASEYFDNNFTKTLAPMLFYTEQEALNRIREAETRLLTREELLDLINSNVGDILEEPDRDARDAMVDEMMLEQVRQNDLDSLRQAFSEGQPVPPPVVIQDVKGRLSLLGGNSRLSIAAAMDIDLPVKVIPYMGSFRVPEASEEEEYA
jgi:hypothetical protein